MPGAGSHNLQFFVYVVESASPSDFFARRSEGDLVGAALRLSGVRSVVRAAINERVFTAALRLDILRATRVHRPRLPILHLSAHGCQEGIELSDGTVITWGRLRDLLRPLNRMLRGRLIVCMSACEGSYASQMAMDDDGLLPFWALVGHMTKPTWGDTAIAYQTFYHLVSKGFPLREAVERMRAASGCTEWVLQTGAEARQLYLNLSDEDAVQILAEMEVASNDPEVAEFDKYLTARDYEP